MLSIRNEILEADEWPAADSADIDWSDMPDDEDVFGQPVLQEEAKEEDLPPAPEFELESD